MIQINEWLPAFVCVMNFGTTIIQKPVKQNSLIVSKWTACANRNLTARNEKNSACDFFSHSWNFDAISCKKMREYREIAPENDPCTCTTFWLRISWEKISHSAKTGEKLWIFNEKFLRNTKLNYSLLWDFFLAISKIQWDLWQNRVANLSIAQPKIVPAPGTYRGWALCPTHPPT